MRFLLSAVCPALLASASIGAEATTQEFAREVERVLPVEKPYDFHRHLETAPAHVARRNPDAKPAADAAKSLTPGKFFYFKDGTAWQGGSHASPLSLCGADKDVEIPDWEYRGGGCNWPNQHWENFLRAVRGEIKTTSSFEVAGPLSQVFTLGCIAQRLNRSLKFDPAKKEFVGDAEANALLSPTPRKGWEEYYIV